MAKFKHKLDDMMGDTSSQERRIKEQVRMKMNKPAKKRAWHIPIVASAATAITLFLFISTVSTNLFTSNEGRGVPYDPLDDFYEISALKRAGELSVMDYTQFARLPTVQKLAPLQYVDTQSFELNGEMYHTVIERKEAIYDEAVYERGDIVRAVNNARNHLPIFKDEYYEIIAVPGDRVVVEQGKLTVNGKAVHSELLEKYEDLNITIVGGYDQLLNIREYLLFNYFPAEKTIQAATINPVHKIFGEVVALAKVNEVDSIYVDGLGADYGPETYFDLYLYDSVFGNGDIARQLMMEGATFPDVGKLEEFFLEAGYRELRSVSEDEAVLRYDFGREGGNVYEFTMYKMPGSNVWQWMY